MAMFKSHHFSLVKLLLLCGLLFLIPLFVFSDVGNFSDYSSGGGSWNSDSSWGWSDSSWRTSVPSREKTYSTDISSESSFNKLFFFFVLIIGIYVAFNTVKKLPLRASAPRIFSLPDHTEAIVKEIQKIDPLFNAREFLTWSKHVFVALQTAWTNFEWDKVRSLETNELYQQHRLQLQEYKDKGWRNVLERINVNNAHLFAYEQNEQNEYLSVYLNTRMVDYVLDENKKTIVKGNDKADCYMQYLYTFVRRKGVQTAVNTTDKDIFTCPKCGAPAKADGNGVCEYCGFTIMTGEFGWVLADINGIKSSVDYGRGGIIINGKKRYKYGSYKSIIWGGDVHIG